MKDIYFKYPLAPSDYLRKRVQQWQHCGLGCSAAAE